MAGRWLRIAAIGTAAVLLAVLVAGRGGRVAADTAAVSINNFAFNPPSVSLSAGGTVTWTNDQTGITHTVTADDGSFDSGRLPPGQPFSHVFSSPGTFAYHCSIHSSMHGTVVVSAGAAATMVPEATATGTPGSGAGGVAPGRSVTFHAGFNLGALPAGTTANPDAAFGFDPQANSYHSLGPSDQPVAGQGYWLFFSADRSVTLGAGSNAPVTLNAAPGTWNLIGNPSGVQPALVTGADSVFTFDQSAGYTAATMLQPGQGAWAFARAGGVITITPGATAPAAASATPAPVTTPAPAATVQATPVHTPTPVPSNPMPNPNPYGY